ncbi:MAG: glycosyltransferase family 9 protein [Planctomycetota bacterium]|jgi:ADP-heptose:LPS heptosyltransferase
MRHLILREAGGMGDVLRTFPVARALKTREPEARVEYVCLAGYEGLVKLSGSVDAVHVVSERERRGRDKRPDPARHPYLARIGAFKPGTRTIDLYCPAYRHEVETGGAVTLDRVELFCRAAGVEPSTPRIELPLWDAARARERLLRSGSLTAENAEESKAGTVEAGIAVRQVPPFSASSASSAVQSSASRPLIGLAPYATHAARSWLGRERLCELGELLRGAGMRLVMFHSRKCPRPNRDEGTPADAGAFPALRLNWRDLAASVAACDVLIAADTGPLHLAGALGVPTVGLFGCTSGEVVCQPYMNGDPTHEWMSASAPPAGCRAPCYGRPSRGYSSKVCGRSGCRALWDVRPRVVAEWALATTANLTAETQRAQRTTCR